MMRNLPMVASRVVSPSLESPFGRPSDSTPTLTGEGAPKRRSVLDAVLFHHHCDRQFRFCGVAFSHLLHQMFCQNYAPCDARMPISLKHVLGVIFLGSFSEVLRPTTRRVVTRVQNTISAQQRRAAQFVGNPMGQFPLPRDAALAHDFYQDLAIPIWPVLTDPRPAAGPSSVNMLPEPSRFNVAVLNVRRKWLAHRHQFTAVYRGSQPGSN